MSEKPNILFFLSDQHNASFMGCSGSQVANTPNLDKLALKGVRFTNTYSQNPLCVPSRSSLITGRYSKNIGIYSNKHILEPNTVTLPRILTANGYRTCVIGKTHINGEQYHGYQQRPYGDIWGQGHQPDPRRTPSRGASGLGDMLENSGPSGIPLPLTQTEICVSEAAKWLQCHIALHESTPFFLSINFDKPHFPLNPPAAFYNKYIGKVTPPAFPEGYIDSVTWFVKSAIIENGCWNHYGKDFEIHKRALAAYYGCIEWIDDAIGRIVDTLEYLGLSDNTIIIYSSDHGEMAGEKGAWQKTLFFDASAKVPLIISYPKKFLSGRTVEDITGLIDIFPTICEAIGCDIPHSCDGLSLIPTLTDNKKLAREGIFSESTVLNRPEDSGCMIRTDRWKYNYYLDGSEELYDMISDPGEWNNLAGSHYYKEVLQELRKKVKDFWQPEKQLDRYHKTPMVKREKHFYQFSNQFILSDGTIIDARP